METVYYYISNRDQHAITNADRSCTECITACASQNELLKCSIFKETRRRGQTKLDTGSLYLCTNDATKSSRLFREKQMIFSDALSRVDASRADISHKYGTSVNRL